MAVVTFEASCTGTMCSNSGDKVSVKLSWNDGSGYTAAKDTSELTTSDATYTLGGSADTWGRSWTDSEFANGTFRIMVDGDCGSSCSSLSRTLNLDQVLVKVYYTPSGGGGGSASTTLSYVHTDHLGGTNVVSDEEGVAAQVLDYYPYGSERIATGDNDTDRHFIGQMYDQESGVIDIDRYANVRCVTHNIVRPVDTSYSSLYAETIEYSLSS